MKKKYYIEYGDGKNWCGAKEVVSDTRYSNALQEGDPLEDEMHALMAELHIHDKSIVTVREAGDDRGFSTAPKTTIAILCVRVWAEEEDDEEESKEDEGPEVGSDEWYRDQGRRFTALRLDWPDIMIDSNGDRGENSDTLDASLLPNFRDEPTQDALERLVRNMWKGYYFGTHQRDDGMFQIIIVTVPDSKQVCHTGFKTRIEACLIALETGKKMGLSA